MTIRSARWLALAGLLAVASCALPPPDAGDRAPDGPGNLAPGTAALRLGGRITAFGSVGGAR